MAPEIEVSYYEAGEIKDYLDKRPQTKRIGIQPGGLWNVDGEAVYLRGLTAASRHNTLSSTIYLLCSEKTVIELRSKGIISRYDAVNNQVEV